MKWPTRRLIWYIATVDLRCLLNGLEPFQFWHKRHEFELETEIGPVPFDADVRVLPTGVQERGYGDFADTDVPDKPQSYQWFVTCV